jgi:hypothetical protein
MGGCVRCKYILLFLIVVCTTSALAQRRGALEMGGSFYFRSGSTAAVEGNSQLDLNWLVASYLSRDYSFEFEPSFLVAFDDDSIEVGGLLMAGIGKRLVDLTPNVTHNYQSRKYDLGTAAAVFGSLGVGMWLSGVSFPAKPGINYSGPLIYAGLNTRTYLGNMTSLRVGLRYAYLFPSGKVYTRARSLWQIGIGFSVFLHT